MAKLGISAESMQNEEHGFHANIEGKYYYCIFKKIETRYMGFIIPMDVLYERIPLDLLNLALCLVLICGTLTVFVANCVNRYVIHDIHRINGKLNRITQGDLEEKVNVQSSREFSALSRYINEMVGSLVNNDRKMSYVLNRTEMNIGTATACSRCIARSVSHRFLDGRMRRRRTTPVTACICIHSSRSCAAAAWSASATYTAFRASRTAT